MKPRNRIIGKLSKSSCKKSKGLSKKDKKYIKTEGRNKRYVLNLERNYEQALKLIESVIATNDNMKCEMKAIENQMPLEKEKLDFNDVLLLNGSCSSSSASQECKSCEGMKLELLSKDEKCKKLEAKIIDLELKYEKNNKYLTSNITNGSVDHFKSAETSKLLHMLELEQNLRNTDNFESLKKLKSISRENESNKNNIRAINVSYGILLLLLTILLK